MLRYYKIVLTKTHSGSFELPSYFGCGKEGNPSDNVVQVCIFGGETPQICEEFKAELIHKEPYVQIEIDGTVYAIREVNPRFNFVWLINDYLANNGLILNADTVISAKGTDQVIPLGDNKGIVIHTLEAYVLASKYASGFVEKAAKNQYYTTCYLRDGSQVTIEFEKFKVIPLDKYYDKHVRARWEMQEIRYSANDLIYKAETPFATYKINGYWDESISDALSYPFVISWGNLIKFRLQNYWSDFAIKYSSDLWRLFKRYVTDSKELVYIPQNKIPVLVVGDDKSDGTVKFANETDGRYFTGSVRYPSTFNVIRGGDTISKLRNPLEVVSETPNYPDEFRYNPKRHE
jgi:hypothetical protein